LFGGDTRGLPIARRASDLISFDDIARSRDLPDEILLHADHWGMADWVPQELPENGIAVGLGRMRVGYDHLFELDPKQRADHPRWKQYWMSLWGGTIEAIAQAWAVPLQDVLEASEIAEEGMEEWIGADGRQHAKPKVDVIRRPR
jgi:hypothetical protein